MIIYKKNSEELVIPVGLGPNVSPITGYELQMKRVDSSTELQHVEPDAGYYGLYRVIVDPYELDSKTVDASTEAQVITSSKDGLFQVIVNPYTLESRNETVTENGTFTYSPSTANGLAQVTVDVSVDTVNNQSKTVDSSTTMQYVQPDEGYTGLDYVAVNPYTLESKSETITASGQYTYTATDADGLSQVTVDVSINDSPELQSKTVDSSTTQQTVQADSGYDGLSQVVVEPYTLDSKTVNPSTNQQTITSDADGLSQVTVNPYTLQNKEQHWSYENPSYDYINVTPDSSYNGLGSVKIFKPKTGPIEIVPNASGSIHWAQNNNLYGYSVVTVDSVPTAIPENIKQGVEILGVTGTYAGQSVNNQNKTVDSSTVSQSVTADSSYTGLGTVTVNPYTTETDSSTLTQNGQYIFTPQNADALSQVTVDVSVETQTPELQSKTVDSSTVQQTVTADSSYDGLSQVVVEPYILDTSTVWPSSNIQVVTSNADGLSSVTVNPPTGTIRLTYFPYTTGGFHTQDVAVYATAAVAVPATSNLTVDSSTVSQTFNPRDNQYRYSFWDTVTVNPYTTETDSSTLTANGTYTFTPQNADALSQVTIDVSVDGQSVNNQNKTVDSSTVSQSVTADNGYTGLGTVTVNPYTLDSSTVDPSINQIVITSNADGLSSVTVNAINAVDGFDTITQNGSYGFDGTHFGGDYINYLQIDVSVDTSVNNQNKTVNSSTVSQSITADNGYTGLGTVTVNPYTTEICSSTLTQNGQYVFTPTNVDAFSQVAINVNVDGQGMNRTTSITLDNLDSSLLWPVPQGSQGRLLNLGHLEKTRVTLGGINENFVVSTKEMLESDPDPDVGGWDFGHVVDGFVKIDTSVGSHIKTITYNVNSIISRDGFATSGPICTSTNAPNLEKISFPMSCYGDYSGYGVDFTGWFAPWKNDIEYEIDSTWFGSSDASVNLTYELGSHLVNLTLPRNYIGGEICYLGWASNLSAESVLTILQNLHVNVSQRPCVCTFYTGGLTVTDYPDGRIQTAYDTAVTNGWTIQNLTIQQPLYAPVDYIQSTGQTLNLGNTLGRYDAVYADYEMAAGDGGIFIGTDGTGAYKFGFGTDGQGNLYEHYGTFGVDTFYGAAAGLNTRYQGCMGIYTDDVGGWTWSDFSYGETYPAYNIDDYDGSGSNVLRFADASNYGKVRSIKVYTNLWWGINVDFDSDYNITFTDQPLYNYEPVMRLSDNAYGLYETTTGTFYTAQGITGGMDPDAGMFECPDCGGTGEVDGDTCGMCGGTGYVNWDPNTGETFECPECGGTGEVDGDTCPTCGGIGYVDWDPTE